MVITLRGPGTVQQEFPLLRLQHHVNMVYAMAVYSCVVCSSQCSAEVAERLKLVFDTQVPLDLFYAVF